jgi:peptidoglycan hydrolase CwlO-like protein
MIRTEYFALTNETVEVELTKEEIAEVKARALEAEKEKAKQEAEAEAKAQAKAAAQAKLAALGLTVEDLQALGL